MQDAAHGKKNQEYKCYTNVIDTAIELELTSKNISDLTLIMI